MSIFTSLKYWSNDSPVFQGTFTAQRYSKDILETFINQLNEYDETRNAYLNQGEAHCYCTAQFLNYFREFFDCRLI